MTEAQAANRQVRMERIKARRALNAHCRSIGLPSARVWDEDMRLQEGSEE